MQNLSLGESQNIGMTHPGWACKFLLGNHKREMKTTWTPEARGTFKYVQSQAETFLDCNSYTNFTILTEEIPGSSLKMWGQEYWHLVNVPLEASTDLLVLHQCRIWCYSSFHGCWCDLHLNLWVSVCSHASNFTPHQALTLSSHLITSIRSEEMCPANSCIASIKWS